MFISIAFSWAANARLRDWATGSTSRRQAHPYISEKGRQHSVSVWEKLGGRFWRSGRYAMQPQNRLDFGSLLPNSAENLGL